MYSTMDAENVMPNRSWPGIGPAWLALAVLLSSCSLLQPAASAPSPDEPQPPAPPMRSVWTATPGLQIADSVALRPFTRLEVLTADSLGLQVRCSLCPGAPEGVVRETDVVVRALPPEVAAWGSLAEFALSIREAAAERDVEALLPAMVDDFSYSFVGVQSPEVAVEVWRSEDFATLDEIPALLDLGLSSVDGRIWAAPPAFTEGLGYRGLRVGFRQRSDGRWEWLYAIRGIVPDEALE